MTGAGEAAIAPPRSFDPFAAAHALALAVPAALLGGALAFQYLGGLVPCEMCYWQRWPHGAAILLALAALAIPRPGRRMLVLLAAAAILVSGAIGVWHWGVEQGIFEGITRCTASAAGGSSADIMADIFATPVVRCDQPQWVMWGLSMAGWNAVLSIGAALAIAWLAVRRAR